MLCTVCSGSIFYCIFKSLNKTKRKLAFLNLGSEVIMNFNKTFDWTKKKKIKRQFKFSCPKFQRLIVKFSNKSFYDDIFCKMNLILKSLFLKLFVIASSLLLRQSSVPCLIWGKSSLLLRQSSVHCLIWGKSAIWVYVFLPAYILGRVIPKTIIKMGQTASLHRHACIRVGVWRCSPNV